jgi:antitoxin (DNA-binding transcriptional repressor) of toxin-antitoxin stability system
MKQLTIREAREALSHLDRILAVEGELTITRRGEPIARVWPVGHTRAVPSHRDLRKSMPKMRKGSEKLIREDRDGR